MDGERMHSAPKLTRQRRIDHAVAFEAALPAEGLSHDIHSEVRFPAGPMPGVAFVPVRFVLNTQIGRRKRLAQLFGDEILSSHPAALAR